MPSRAATAAPAAKPRRRTQAERRASSKRKLLDATAKVIADHGTTNVSFAEIAKVADCSHGLPGYLFGSKNDLLLALVEDIVEIYRKTIDRPAIGDLRGLDALLASLRATLKNFARFGPHTRAIYILMGEAPGLAPEVQEAVKQYQHVFRSGVAETIAEGIEDGDIRADLDPDTAAVVVYGLVRGIGQQVLLDRKALDLPAVTDMAVDSVYRTLSPKS